MTQPRKEQIKNLKTKYIQFSQTGTLVLSGGPTQIIQNTTGESFYDELLAATRSQIVGGTETSSPAILYGGFGPFALATNSTINILIPGVNGGLSIPVIFQSSDFVTLSGLPKLTTWRAANRINIALVAVGVSTPTASNVDGQLIIKAADSSGILYGNAASITITDVTPGVVLALGLGSTNSINAVGVQGPTRGIITNSQDGLGGYIQLRAVDSSALEPKNSQMLHIGARTYAPRFFPAQPAFARLQAFPGAVLNGRNFKVTYWRKGPKRPSLVTSQGTNKSNFSSITPGEQITVSVDMGGGFGLVCIPVTTFGTITTVQQVVDAINTTWTSASLVSFGVEATRASIKLGYAGPYLFSNPAVRDSFFVSFNGNTPIHINPPAGFYTTSDLISYINGQITLASQTLEGEATSLTDPGGNTRVIIQSKRTIASQSSVQIYPGNPGGSVPGTFMETLDMLGLVPGLYSGTNIVELYGSDEIRFINPSAFENSSITVSFSSALVSAKLGLNLTQTSNQTIDLDTCIVPQAVALLPEMLEFSEEPDNYDSDIQSFDIPGTKKVALPVDGVANANLSSLLNLDGKLLADLLPRILGFLGVDQLRLGTGLINSILDQKAPRIFTEQEISRGPVLIWEGSPTSGASATRAISRLYSDNGTIYLTSNAFYDTGATPWVRDTNAKDSYFIEITSGKLSIGIIKTTDSSPWADSAWKRNLKFNLTELSDSIYGTEIINIGESLVTGTSPLLSRFKFPAVQDPSNPTLLFSCIAPSGVSARVYYISLSGGVSISPFLPAFDANTVTTGFSTLYITTNAYYDSTSSTWNKDIAGKYATLLTFSQSKFSYSRIVSDSPWTVWPDVISVDSITGKIAFGSTAIDAITPRLSAPRFDPVNEFRTLLFETPIGGTNATTAARIYLNCTQAYLGSGFTFTRNCLWDNLTDTWVQENSAADGIAVHIGNGSIGQFAITNKQSPASPWTDDEAGWGVSNSVLFDAGSSGIFNMMLDGDYKYKTPKTSIISCPKAWYQFYIDDTSGISWGPNLFGNFIPITLGTGSKNLIVWTDLPIGSIITRVRAVIDPGASETIQMYVRSMVASTGAAAIPGTVSTVISSGSSLQTLDTGTISVTVNNSFSSSNMNVFIWFYIPSGTGGTSLHNVAIDFTNPGLSNE